MLVLSAWLADRPARLVALLFALAASVAILVMVGADGILLCTTGGGFPRK